MKPRLNAFGWALGLFAAGTVSAATPSSAEPTPVETMRRLYDFTPVGPDNPVLARLPAYSIEIPLSEYRAYVASEMHEGSKPAEFSLPERRRLLENLIDEHLWLWAGYQAGADQKPGVAATLRSTQTMLLGEAFIQQEVVDKARSRPEYEALEKKLCDEIFDRTEITVSNEAYAKLKQAARSVDGTARALQVVGRPSAVNSGSDPTNQLIDRLPPEVRDAPLADCKAATVTIGDFLATFTRTPRSQRGDLDKPGTVVEVLKQMLMPVLIAAEARTRGFERAPLVREKMQLNRNTLSRLYALDQLTAKIVAHMRTPEGQAEIKQWYQDHLKSLYTAQGPNGKEQVLSFDANRDQVEDDYFQDRQDHLRAEQLKAWRQGSKIEIDEIRFAQAAL